MEYTECKILSKLKRKSVPITSQVPCDMFTAMVEKNFDYKFTGISSVYPFEFPYLTGIDYRILCIVGASGSGKSTLLKEIGTPTMQEYDCSKAIVSNFDNPRDAAERLSAVGLNSLPVWCKPRNVLSVGEGFRADLALNLKSGAVFDEFTSTIDRNVAKGTCAGIRNYVDRKGLKDIVFCSCHKDYIPYLKPDIVIDLDYENVYDCRGAELGEQLPYKSTEPMQKICGEYLGSITI